MVESIAEMFRRDVSTREDCRRAFGGDDNGGEALRS